MRDKHYFKGGFQIFLLVVACFAFAYIVDKNTASAQTSVDFGLYTCVEGDEGFCNIYISSRQCESVCDSGCIPSADVADCELGTCYDAAEGVCQGNAPKTACEKRGGSWDSDSQLNMIQCQKGCCVLGGNAFLTTDRECNVLTTRMGLEKDYRPELNDWISCIDIAAGSAGEGACVLESSSFVRNCIRTNENNCLGFGGEFYSGFLCTTPELNTICERTTGGEIKTTCTPSKDGVYFKDSCGNIANIYDVNKINNDDYWTRVIPKEESCSLESFGDHLANKAICGNCDVVDGSICAEDSEASIGDNACIDLSCGIVDGEERGHLESWCYYQGQVGLNDEGTRSRDVPGSRHFRKTCQYGEVTIDACDGSRGYICTESREQRDGEQFSFAACRPNTGLACLYVNSGDSEEVAKLCENLPDCVLKNVYVSPDWNFKICVPKYPPGFNLKDPNSNVGTCGIATQKCTVIEQYHLGDWQDEKNTECRDVFPKVMQELCMSLGDCGASVNQIGEYTKNIEVRGPFINYNYINGVLDALKNYHQPIQGEYIDATEGLNQTFVPGVGKINTAEMDEAIDTAAARAVGGLAIVPAFGITAATPGLWGTSLGATAGTSPYTAAAIGAAIGYAVVTYLISFLDAPGLDEAFVNALTVAGTIGGALIALGGKAAAGGVVVVIVVVIIILFLAILGIGKQRETHIYFTCEPWQPKPGGEDCERCGEDGLGCSRYACHALGKTCDLVNEGTSEEVCADIGGVEIMPPHIRPLDGALDEGYSYDEEETIGFEIIGPDGCIEEYEQINFGIDLDEIGRCNYDVEDVEFDSMSYSFSNGLSFHNHTTLISSPSLASLGIVESEADTTGNARLYVNCEDERGNIRDGNYVIEFCVKPGDLSRPPIITRGHPPTDYVAEGAESTMARVFTDIPADCKWSLVDKDYDLMEYPMDCYNAFPDDLTIFGYICQTSTEIPFPIMMDSNNYYVRCKSRPWETNESRRESNAQSYEFVLRKSDKLNVDYVTPNNGTIEMGVNPAAINIEAGTSGGINGNAACSYILSTDYLPDAHDIFYDTWDTIHKQTLVLREGRHVLNVSCEDRAGNRAEKVVIFNLDLDSKPPIVSRVYNQDGTLVIHTDEDAECAYSLTSCNFNFEDGTLMTSVGNLHTTLFDSDEFRIKCRDDFGNMPGRCSIIVKRG